MSANDPKALASAAIDENAARGLVTWTVSGANREWAGADYQVLLPRGGWWPAPAARDHAEAEAHAKAFWDTLTEADLAPGGRYGTPRVGFEARLASFGADHPGFVAVVSGPWPEREGDPSWIVNVKCRDLNWHDIHAGSRGSTPSEALDRATRFLAEWSRRRDLGDRVTDSRVLAEIEAVSEL